MAFFPYHMASGKRPMAQASAALADIEGTRAGFAGEREALLAAARKAAEQERAAILAKAATEAAGLEAEAKGAAARDIEAANRAWTERASRLADLFTELLQIVGKPRLDRI